MTAVKTMQIRIVNPRAERYAKKQKNENREVMKV
jgi:hypothetical protein